MNYAIEINELTAASISAPQQPEESDQDYDERKKSEAGKSLFGLTVLDVAGAVQPVNGSPNAQMRRLLGPYFDTDSDAQRYHHLAEALKQASETISDRERGKSKLILTLD